MLCARSSSNVKSTTCMNEEKIPTKNETRSNLKIKFLKKMSNFRLHYSTACLHQMYVMNVMTSCKLHVKKESFTRTYDSR